MKRPFNLAILALLFLLTLSSGLNATAQRRRSRGRQPAALQPTAADLKRQKTFELVWQTVKDNHFDPTFGGVDWDAVRTRYAPLVKRTTSDAQLHNLLQSMLNELKVSHLVIIPPEAVPRYRRKRSERVQNGNQEDPTAEDDEDMLDETEEGDEGNADLTDKLLNNIGIDFRILDDKVMVTRVAEDSPAAGAGIRPGYILTEINGFPLKNTIAFLKAVSGAYSKEMAGFVIYQSIFVQILGGKAGSEVALGLLDNKDQPLSATLKRAPLHGELSPPVGNLPPMYTEFEAKRIEDGIGYIRFSTFSPILLDRICGALKSMKDAKGVIVDLRGNPGGIIGMASGVSGMLAKKAGLIGMLKMRTGRLPLGISPQRSTFQGPVVVLIDGLSASTSEVFAAGMQELGRATIIGEKSAGLVQGADTIKLPTGAILEYAMMGFTTTGGASLEGNGVLPDIPKRLDRASLLAGRDVQVEEAIKQIESPDLPKQAPAAPAPPPAPRSPRPLATVTIVADKSAPAPSTEPEPPKPEASKKPFEASPEAERVMERYIEALGGRKVLLGLKNQLSTGTCTMPTQGLKCRVTAYGEAPNRVNLRFDVQALGTMQVAFDGNRAWFFDPLVGVTDFEGPVLEAVKNSFDFYRTVNYKQHYSKLEYVGRTTTTEGEIDMLNVYDLDGNKGQMQMDAKTGLLKGGDSVIMGDYRKVGESMVPFSMSMNFAGRLIQIQFDEVKNDVPADPQAFAPVKSCLTQPLPAEPAIDPDKAATAAQSELRK